MLAPRLHSSLRSPHGFFTREGGTSTGPFASLNCGDVLGGQGGDDPSQVAQNRELIREALGADRLLTLRQVHGDRVVHAEDFDSWGGSPIEADGLVARTPGIALGIQTADCAPVLFEDENAGVIGACHAGWRGALEGIVDTTLESMISLGASVETTRAVVGPCISHPSYEVGDSFRRDFLAEDESGASFFAEAPPEATSAPWIGDGWHFDLPGYVEARIARLKVSVSRLNSCTYAEPEAFFSYRRATHGGSPSTGRQLSAIVLPR